MLIIVAPGQGAQTPGFLTPWLEDPTFANRMEWMSTVAGIDLRIAPIRTSAATWIASDAAIDSGMRASGPVGSMRKVAVAVTVERGKGFAKNDGRAASCAARP